MDGAHVRVLARQSELTLVRLALGEWSGAPGATRAGASHVVTLVAAIDPLDHAVGLDLDDARLIAVVDDRDLGQATRRRARCRCGGRARDARDDSLRGRREDQ